MKKLYIIRDKRLYKTVKSLNNPDPLKEQIALDPETRFEDFGPDYPCNRDFNILSGLLQQHFAECGYNAGEISPDIQDAEKVHERLELFLPWLRRFWADEDLGLVLYTIGLRVEIREV